MTSIFLDFLSKLNRHILRLPFWHSGAATQVALVFMAAIILPKSCYATDVAVYFALDADLKTLAAEAKSAGQPVKIGSRTIHRLEINGHRVYAIKMGSGAVETAVSATTLLTRFHCDLAFSIGPVGALDDALPIGSWHKVGQVSRYQHGSWTPTGFEEALPPLHPERPGGTNLSGQPSPIIPLSNVDAITVASGEIFVASSSYRDQLRAATHAQAVDMNLFGLEVSCESQQVPLVSWRVVSDRADDKAGETFRAFITAYDGIGGHSLAEIIRRLPADPNAPATYPALQHLLEESVKLPPVKDSSAKPSSSP